uniref:Myb/SANT-like domain-containing protein n=2 Tax=Chenopodium quinoa TaxID=63459 RepID=A0A803N1Q8_CHEQI
MDEILTNTLFEQINEGNKGDGYFKSQAYQAVVDKLRADLGMSITVDHVRNRINVWKKHYSVIPKIRTYTKFKWDEKKKMVVIPPKQLADWYMYCMEATQAAAYQNKFIENWDDICTLFASDRTTGEGAEHHDEAVDAMDTEIEGGSTSETSSGGSNKRLKRDRLADVVSYFAESLKDYVSRTQGPPKPSSQEIYEVISSVLGISRHQVLQAVKRFMNGTNDFEMLKNLSEGEN